MTTRTPLLEISFSGRSAASVTGPLVDWSARRPWIKLDLTERRLIIRHVLLQKGGQRLGLLRAKINSLKVSHLRLRLRALLHGSENQEEIPHIDPYLHAVGISLAVVGRLHKLHIRLDRRIHDSKCNA